MNYPDSVQFLYALGNEIKTAKLGLERVAALLDALGAPHREGRFVHVAGTNGKGSVCAMIESGLRAAGFRTGLFTSPHLLEPTERIRIDGVPVAPERFAAAFDRVHAAAEELIDAGRLDSHPTYFETVTAMAFLLFREEGTGYTVLETGLGGRLDATNVATPDVAVITPVDFDHEALLGKSLEAIAGEKAGILKPGAPAVFASQRPEAAAVLERRAAELGIRVVHTGDWAVRDLALHPGGSRFTAAGPETLHITCPLAGEHQAGNALTAAAALLELGVPVEAIERGIARTRWPGRLERVAERPDIVLDGAHNPAGARALADYIRRFYSGAGLWLIYGAMRDKAIHETGGVLFPLATHLIATAPAQGRAARPETVAELADHPRVRVVPSLAAALALARREARPEDAIFVTGSLFLVAEAQALLGARAL
jgi:dihydrofolate synthase / folylpolyglutamate synthase